MNLPKVLNNNSKSKGFTLVEMLLVIGIAITIGALAMPVAVNFYVSQGLDETTRDIVETLRRARSQAITQYNDSAFGVRFEWGSYILFQGSSYASRTQSEDETFTFITGTGTSGITEVVFAKLTGKPNSTGTLTVATGNKSQNISINVQGKIEIE